MRSAREDFRELMGDAATDAGQHWFPVQLGQYQTFLLAGVLALVSIVYLFAPELALLAQ